jgi:predicted secreted acid phosphatase
MAVEKISEKNVDFIMNRNSRYVQKMHKDAISYDQIETSKSTRITLRNGKELKIKEVDKTENKVECCRTCRNFKNCRDKKSFTSKGVVSVGDDFEDFKCKNFKPMINPSNDAEVKKLLKSFKKMM